MAKKKYTGEKRGAKPLPAGERKVRMTIFVEERMVEKIGKSKCKVIAELAISNKYHDITIEY